MTKDKKDELIDSFILDEVELAIHYKENGNLQAYEKKMNLVNLLSDLKVLRTHDRRTELRSWEYAYNTAIDKFAQAVKAITYTTGTEASGYYNIHAICERDIDELAERLKGHLTSETKPDICIDYCESVECTDCAYRDASKEERAEAYINLIRDLDN